jgi:IS30 family transposase
MSAYKQLEKDLGIDKTFTKIRKKQKVFNSIKLETNPNPNYNDMVDLLHLPTTSKGYKYLLVVVDLANNHFDMQELKSKSSSETLDALKTIFKRKYIKKPYASITSDGGTEFKGDFQMYLYNNNIYHKTAMPYRHKQLANVERLNRALGSFLNG